MNTPSPERQLTTPAVTTPAVTPLTAVTDSSDKQQWHPEIPCLDVIFQQHTNLFLLYSCIRTIWICEKNVPYSNSNRCSSLLEPARVVVFSAQYCSVAGLSVTHTRLGPWEPQAKLIRRQTANAEKWCALVNKQLPEKGSTHCQLKGRLMSRILSLGQLKRIKNDQESRVKTCQKHESSWCRPSGISANLADLVDRTLKTHVFWWNKWSAS